MSPDRDHSRYVSFWGNVGSTFPSLKGAASTHYYFECERMLHEQFFPQLKDLLLLKTDLWDEAKNTEILRWAAEQGARPIDIDISFDIVDQARDVLQTYRAGLMVSDVRSLSGSAQDSRSPVRPS